MPRLLISVAAALLVATALGACRTPSVGVYRIDVQQGNVITQDMIDQLEPGMDKRKVRFVLGTPLISDTFNPDRWDYYYSFQDRRKRRSHRRLTLFFEEGQLARIDGDVTALAERRPPAPRPEQVVVVPERREPGLIAALAPAFLKRDKREDALQRSSPEELESQSAASAAAAGGDGAGAQSGPEDDVASLAPGPAAPTAGVSAERAEEEDRYFQQLFNGYGRARPADAIPGLELGPEPEPGPVREPTAEPKPATETAEPVAPAKDEEVAGTEGAAPEASEEEKGFFSRMVEKMRREREDGPAEQAPEAPASEGEAPGEED